MGTRHTQRSGFTVVEAIALDRPGLLYDLTSEMSALNLNIASAHVSTFGERAVDVFYVTDLTGAQVTGTSRQKSIRRRLERIFEPEKPKTDAARPRHETVG